MNTKNNKRKRESIEKIEKSFINMLQSKGINQISVTDICKDTGLNRSTFYANFIDIYDLANKLKEKLEAEFSNQFSKKEQQNSLTMFKHIYDNQLFYKTYFKLGYDEKHSAYIYDTEMAEKYLEDENIKYHIEFFKSGLNAIIKMWLAGGCKETPEEMDKILKAEYKGRKK
ncbi:MAG: TetR/AcrR family transcriptional regulator [Clostridia bacterium]|nr:TetR/AcrR family transcriptional regulator [Clostridia bacterium]